MVLGCPGVTFHLPRYNQVTDYVRYRAYFPSMKEGTACMWLETAEFSSGEPSPLSYAVNGQNNEWLLFLNTRTVRVIVGGNSVDNSGDLSLWSQWSGDLQKVGFTVLWLLLCLVLLYYPVQYNNSIFKHFLLRPIQHHTF